MNDRQTAQIFGWALAFVMFAATVWLIGSGTLWFLLPVVLGILVVTNIPD